MFFFKFISLKGDSGYLFFQDLIICRLGTSRYLQNGAYTCTKDTCDVANMVKKGNRREMKKDNTLEPKVL